MLETLVTAFVVANAAEALAATIQAYVGPILLLIIGLVALPFLFRRQLMAFGTFVLIAILVAIFFYYPGIILSIAGQFVGETGIGTGGTVGS
jgi:hypothetical protein